MGAINIEQSHSLGRIEASKRVRELGPSLRDRYGVRLDWRGDVAELKGSGVSGTIAVREEQVDVRLELGLLLRPMAGKIRQSIEAQISRALS